VVRCARGQHDATRQRADREGEPSARGAIQALSRRCARRFGGSRLPRAGGHPGRVGEKKGSWVNESSMTGRILTVQGPIAPEQLGVCMAHEHLIVDSWAMWQVPNYSLIVDDVDLITEEVQRYRDAGGNSIVDVTNIGLGRDPKALRQISCATGLNLVMGTGWYRERAYPSYIQEMSANELAALMVREIEEGVDGTDVRAGIIGEIGTERGFITPAQERVFRASARAHLQTGAPISTHTTHWGELALEQLALLGEEGVDPRHVIISHLGDRRSIDFFLPIAETGAFLGIDNIGYVDYQKEERRAQNVIELMQAGYRDQILLSMDNCTLNDLHWYGGKGFDYLMLTFIPLLKQLGATDDDVHALMVENPSRALVFSEPKRPHAQGQPS
jgi:phosphotriesterase-related protein